MADGITLNSGSGGAMLLTDETASGHAQIVKLAISTDGNATLIPADATNGIDVDVTRVSGTVTVDGSGVTQPVSGTVSITANSAVNVAQINGTTVTMGNGASGTGVQRVTVANDSTGILAGVTTVTTLTGGGVAHDGADSGNPLKVGAKAETSPKGITLVADGDRSDLYCDADGILMVKNGTAYGDLISERVSNTDGSSTAFSTFGAAANLRNFITSVTVHNAHATTNGYVDLRDGTSGSILWTFPLPATGGATHNFNPPLRQPTANTALAYDVSAAITTVYISVNGFQSKA